MDGRRRRTRCGSSTGHMLPFHNLDDDKAPGFSVEVLRQVLRCHGPGRLLREFPLGSRLEDGAPRRDRWNCHGVAHQRPREDLLLPTSPLKYERWVLFVRTADIATLKFFLVQRSRRTRRRSPRIGSWRARANRPCRQSYGNSCASITTWLKRPVRRTASACWQVVASTTPSRTSPPEGGTSAAMGLIRKDRATVVAQRDRRRFLCMLHQGARFTLPGRGVLARIEGIQADRGVSSDIPQIFP